MNNRKLLIIDAGFGTQKIFGELFPEVKLMNSLDDITADSTLLLEGGADITPTFYNESKSKHVHFCDTERDTFELAAVRRARDAGAAVIGICRGAQMLCIAGGGKLIQHVTNHHKPHFIQTYNGKEMATTSLHHQMMYPWAGMEDWELLAWTTKPISDCYINGVNEEWVIKADFSEPEIVWWPRVRWLGIQGHPEMVEMRNKKDSPFVRLCLDLVKDCIFCRDKERLLQNQQQVKNNVLPFKRVERPAILNGLPMVPTTIGIEPHHHIIVETGFSHKGEEPHEPEITIQDVLVPNYIKNRKKGVLEE